MQPSEAELEVAAEAIGPVLNAGETIRLELSQSQASTDRLETRLGIKLERAQLIGTNVAALAVWNAGAERPFDRRFLILKFKYA